MNETEAIKTPDRNVDLELASGGGILLRASEFEQPQLSQVPRERARKLRLLPS